MVDNNCLNMKYRKRRLTMAEELTLEKFEEAYNIIKKVVLPIKAGRERILQQPDRK